jgi:hypothetical protein
MTFEFNQNNPMKTPTYSILTLLLASTAVCSALDFVTANLAPTATPAFGWPGIVGTRFGVEANDIPAGARVRVTHLGFYAGTSGQFPGSNAVDVQHNVTLSGPQNYNNRRGDFSSLPVASAVIPVGNPVDVNGWSWVQLPSPVVLQGGQYYVVAVDNVTNALDPYFDPDKGPGGSASILAPGSIFRNGLGGGDDGYMSGRYGLANGWEAYYSTGYLGASFQYTLDTAPVISTDIPTSTLLVEGGNANLSVALSPAGYPDAPTYLWQHDPLPLDDVWVTVGTDPSYFIGPATAADAGRYRVTVTNSAGSDQSIGTVIVDPDTDGDGLGNSVETNTGVFVSASNTGTNPAVSDSDVDGLSDGEEVLTFNTNPTLADTDTDGLNDGNEVDVHFTNPLLADSDADDLLDGAEINTHTTNPLVADTDLDGFWDGYELTNGSLPTNAASPGGPNPTAIGVSFNNANGEITDYGLSSIMYAGAPSVRQKNWNRTIPLEYGLNATEASVASPSPGQLVDSAGNPTTMTMSFTASGAWGDDNEDQTTYGRLFGPFIYAEAANPDVTINLGNIPYATYDVYVYMGAAANGFTGTVSSGSTTYSYTTASNATSGGALGVNVYTETTAPTGFPLANYCVFRNVSGSTFSFKHTRGNLNAGIFGFQVVESSATPFQTWAISKGLDPNTDGAPGFDKENDGASNLLEYAFFTDPNSGSSLPVFPPSTAGGNLSITYNRAKAASDVTYIAQWSENLADWFPTGLTDSPTGNETVDTVERVVTVTQDGDPKKFLRILVSIPTP